MLRRQTTGSVVCTSCGVLVGVRDDKCYNCGRRNPGLWGYAPALRALGHDLGFVPFVLGTCIVLYGLSLILTVVYGGSIMGGGLLSILSPHGAILEWLGSSGARPILQHHWWTVLSAGWLHGGILHLAFNMMAVRQLAPAIADLFGPGRMVIIYTAGSIVGFTLSSVAGAYIPGLPVVPGLIELRGAISTVGSSASIAGLIGAVLAYGHRSGSSQARSYARSYILMLVLMGFFLPFVDNYAHLGGFGGGYLVAKFLDPLKPERVDHMVIALVCVAASMLSIVATFLLGPPF